MKTTRIKKQILDPSLIDIDATVGYIAQLKNAERQLVTDMDEEIAETRARYSKSNPLLSDPCTSLGLAAIREEIDVMTERAQLWAKAHPEKFAKRKSIELTHGTIGFRLGTPKLKALAKWTMAKVLQALKDNKVSEYIRVKETIDKKALLKDAKDVAIDQFGLRVVREETFFVDPKLTELETREVTPTTQAAA